MDTLEQYLARRPDDTPPPLLAPGTILGRWKIDALLARGGSGEVYRAEATTDGSVAAVKVLFRTGEASRRRFLREIEIFAACKSDAFPRLFGSGEFDGRAWYAMELLEPCELPHTDRPVADFLLNVCTGVAELHRLGFVHRDIKPANVMRRAGGPCVLIDLGLVKPSEQPPVAKGASISIVEGRAVGLGTVGYAAPEQLVGGGVSTASDIHALGVLANVCFHDNPPRAWKRIILRATSSLPDYRYRTVDEFMRAIQRRHVLRRILIGATLVALFALSALGLSELHARILPTTLELHGETRILTRPVRLKNGESLSVIGPGRLEADISGETGSRLSLTNCVVMNLTTEPLGQSGIKYELLNGVYLNFRNLEKPLPYPHRRFNQYDGKFNDVRFNGPITVEALKHQAHAQDQKELLNWATRIQNERR